MKIKIIDAQGNKLSTGTAFIRLLAQVGLSIVPFGSFLDLLWPLWDVQRQTLHDKAVGSFAVNDHFTRMTGQLCREVRQVIAGCCSPQCCCSNSRLRTCCLRPIRIPCSSKGGRFTRPAPSSSIRRALPGLWDIAQPGDDAAWRCRDGCRAESGRSACDPHDAVFRGCDAVARSAAQTAARR